MFDNIGEEKIKKILQDVGGNIERAVDQLLSLPVLETNVSNNVNSSTTDNIGQEQSDALFAQKLMLEEINRDKVPIKAPTPTPTPTVSTTSDANTKTPDSVDSDEEFAKRLQSELNAENEDERLARQLQSHWNVNSHGGHGNSGYIPPRSNNTNHQNDDIFANFDIAKLTPEILEEFKNTVKEQMIPVLLKQLKEVELPEVNESIDAGKKFGNIGFRISGMKVEDVDIPKDKVTIELEGQQVELKITDIKLNIEKFDWRYKKEKFPKLKDKGQASCGVSEVQVNVRLTWAVRNGNPSVNVTLCEVKIGNLNLKISGTVASVLYNIILAAVKRLIKAQLENAMADMIKSSISEHAEDLFEET